jgi:NTE family protein
VNDYDRNVATPRRPAVPRRRPKRVGLALGAGGARGLAHIGVLRSLSEAGVPIDAVVGTSIGAVVGAAFAAGQLERFEQRLQEVVRIDVLRLFDPVWPRAGIISGERAVEWLRGLVGDWRIEDLAIPFGAVTVDLVTGEELLIRKGPVIDALRASMSVPGILVPMRSSGRVLVDGAVRNPVPVSELQAFDVDVTLAVNLHGRPVRELRSPRSRSVRDDESFAGRLYGAVESRLSRIRRRDPSEPVSGPNLLEILTASMTVMEHELARHRLAYEPVDVILEPDVHSIRSFEFHRARAAIRAGRIEVEGRLGDIRAALARRRRTRTRPPREQDLSTG